MLSMIFLHACSGGETLPPGTNPPDNTTPPNITVSGGTWERAGYAGGGLFTSVVMDPNTPTTVYAASDVSGVYRSVDNGDNWTMKSTGLSSHAIADLIIDPFDNTRLWATTAMGLFRSDDSADTWTAINTNLAAYILVSFQSVTVSNDGQTILATHHINGGADVFQNDYRTATLTGALYRSTDGGANWSEVTNFPATYPTGTRFPAVQFDPYNVGVALLAVSGYGILRSTDGGQSWAEFSTGLPSNKSDLAWRSLTFSATSVYAAASQLQTSAAGTPYIYRSNSSIAGWSSIAGDLTTVDSTSVQQNNFVVRVSPVNDIDINIAYAGFPSLFYKSDDAGVTWQGTSVETAGAYVFDTAAAPFQNTRNPFEDFIDLAIDPANPDHLFATNWVSIWRSTDRGTTWQEKVRGTQNTVCTDILYTGTEFFSTHWDTILQRSTNPTVSWSESLPVAGSPSGLAHGWSIVQAGSGTLFVGVSIGSGAPRVYRSSDGGTTWADSSPSFASSGDTFIDSQTKVTMAVDPTDPNTVYAVNRLATQGIHRSTNGGDSWTKLSSQPESGNSSEVTLFETLAVDPDDGTRLYAGTFWDGLWYSANSGATWTLAKVNGVNAEGVLVQDMIAQSGGVVWAAVEDGVYKSTDQGVNYTRSLGNGVILAEFEYFTALAVNPANPDELFAASVKTHPVYSLNGSVWQTTDGGANWKNITGDLDHKRVNTLEYADGYIYAGIEGANIFRQAIQ